MLSPAFGKIYPLSAFDTPENHQSPARGNLKLVGLMLSSYLAGHRHRPEAHELVEWIKRPEGLKKHKLGALREFVDSWTGFDLWVVHVNSGCTIYEIANAMRVAGAMAPLSVHAVNTMAVGYCGSDDEPGDDEFLMHYGSMGLSPLSGWGGFSIIQEEI